MPVSIRLRALWRLGECMNEQSSSAKRTLGPSAGQTPIRRQMPIAVVGMAALYPGSIQVEGFWRNIFAGRDLITDVPADHWRIDDYYDVDPKKRGQDLWPARRVPAQGALQSDGVRHSADQPARHRYRAASGAGRRAAGAGGRAGFGLRLGQSGTRQHHSGRDLGHRTGGLDGVEPAATRLDASLARGGYRRIRDRHDL